MLVQCGVMLVYGCLFSTHKNAHLILITLGCTRTTYLLVIWSYFKITNLIPPVYSAYA